MPNSDGYATRSDAGLVRPGNEDRVLARPPLFAVADGMGGHRGGEVASELAVTMLAAATERDPGIDGDAIVQVFTESNAAIRREAGEQPTLAGMGTTCTAALIGAEIRIAHVGDSRAYLLRDGGLQQLTTDHSLVARMISEGVTTADGDTARGIRHIITRALGATDELRVDVVAVARAPGDRLLLCTDGLHGQVDDDTICRILGGDGGPEAASAGLVEAANAAGGDDNVTVVVVDVDRVVELAAGRPSS